MGEATTTLNVATDDDQVMEADGSVTAEITAGQGYTVGTPAAATAAILDNEVAVDVAVTIGSPVAESAGPVTVTLTATTAEDRAPAGVFLFVVTTADGTALEGTDYERIFRTAPFVSADFERRSDGSGFRYVRSYEFTTGILDDAAVEGDETFTIRLYTLAPELVPPWVSVDGTPFDGTAREYEVTITDDDAAPVVATASPLLVPENGTAVATLQATDADTPAADLVWSLAGGADAGAFALTAGGVLAFQAAPDFEAPDDADTDGDYEVTVRVSDGANAAEAALTVRLVDVDDTAPELTDATVTGAALTLTFDEALDDASVPPADAFTVAVGGTARDVDLVTLSGSAVALTLAAPVAADATVTVGYAPPTGAGATPLQDAAGNAVAAFSDRAVTNHTPVPALAEVSITAPAAPVTEGADAAFTLSRTESTAAALTVAVSVTADGHVPQPAQRRPRPTFAVGDTTTTLNVATDDDQVMEADGSVTAAITAGQGYTVGTPAAATAAILDNEVAVDVAVTIGSPVAESAGPVTVTLTATTAEDRAPAGVFLFVVTTADGTALEGTDYERIFRTAPFVSADFERRSDGSGFRYVRSYEFTTGILDDAAVEGDETFTIRLYTLAPELVPPWVSVDGTPFDGTARAFEVTITDDDAAPVVVTASPILVPENGTAVATLQATDADTPAADLVWSLAGGADAGAFALTAGGVLAFQAAPDFEAPGDTDANGDYEVTVRVTDGANAAEAALTVRLVDVDDTAPELTDATVNGAALTLTFDEPLDDASVPPADAFTVAVGGTARDVDLVTLAGSTATLTLAAPVAAGATVTAGYTPPAGAGATPLRDAAGNAVAGFSGRAVTNETPVPALPEVSIAAASAPVTEGADAAFTLTRSGAAAAALTVAVSVTEAGAVLSGTAPSAVTFPAHAAEAQLRVATLDDEAAEADARVTAAVVSGAGYRVAADAGTAGIDVLDNDRTAQAVTTVWSADMTVVDFGSGSIGAASADLFSNIAGSEEIQVRWLWYYAPDRTLYLKLSQPLLDSEELTLHLGAVAVAFPNGDAGFTWYDVELDWTDGQTVAVRLTKEGDEDQSTAGPGVSVADAEVREAAGASLVFQVTLEAAQTTAVSVRYATADGTATAGADYVAASGAVRFEPGETERTVAVAVLDDAHDEGAETLALTLSYPFGARVADGEATGTITNVDALPRAWLARFGRTAAEQVLGAVDRRLRAARSAETRVTLAGHRVPRAAPVPDAAAIDVATEEQWAAWMRGDTEASRARLLSVRELLSESSFQVGAPTTDGGTLTLWGGGALTRFGGRDGAFELDGDVWAGLLGADYASGGWLAGLALAYHESLGGSYRPPAAGGELHSWLVGGYPYVGYAAERLALWGAAGYGQGRLTMTAPGDEPLETGIRLLLGAGGARGELLVPASAGGAGLAVNLDALVLRTSSEATPGLAAAEADVSRLRLAVEGSYALSLGGSRLTPTAELGVRHDGGHAETGFGLDLSGGLSWSAPALGLAAQVSGHGLLAHEAAGFHDWGVAGSLSYDPNPASELGLSLSLSPAWGGSAASAAAALWARPTLVAPTADAARVEPAGRITAEAAYGLPLFGGTGVGTPYLGLGLADSDRDYRVGYRLGIARAAGREFSLSIEGTRHENAAGTAPRHTLTLQGTHRW